MRDDMDEQELRKEAHDVDVTVWVGKAGIESVADELETQLEARKLVKVKFLRAARGGTSTAELADELAELVDADLIETRGNTGVFH
jgi:RNA-binding protein